jgi:DNA-binding HxlR family transcriptional regulator
MTQYGQFCPVAQALEVVGERWTLLIVRELLCGNYRFNEMLHGVPLMSRSLLSQRLKTLEAAGLIERHARDGGRGQAYRLTEAGRELEPIVMGLGSWGQRWARRKFEKQDLDPVLFMWDLRRHLDRGQLPADPICVMFWFRDVAATRSRYWLRVAADDVDLCLTNPGFEVELTVETTIRTMVEVWLGDRKLDGAVRDGTISLQGTPKLVRGFPRWLKLSPFASVPLPSGAATR